LFLWKPDDVDEIDDDGDDDQWLLSKHVTAKNLGIILKLFLEWSWVVWKKFSHYFFKIVLWKRMGEYVYVSGVCLIFSTTLKWWTSIKPGQFTPSTFWVGDWGLPNRWSGCGGEIKISASIGYWPCI
jgi:hypothetical protein